MTMAVTPPPEFVCPISGSLMADPVIVPTDDLGRSFDRVCVEACAELGYCPLDVAVSNPPRVIPNANLKAAIAGWCDRAGAARPHPLKAEVARGIVRLRIASGRQATRQQTESDLSSSLRTTVDLSSSFSTMSFQESPPLSQEFTPADPLEVEALQKLTADAEPSEKEAALLQLRRATKADPAPRLALCSARMLEALRRMLRNSHAGVQLNAVAVLINLSLEPQNRVQIVRAAVVPDLVEMLSSQSPDLRDYAAGAIHGLAVEPENRVPIGVLGAIPPLLNILSGVDENSHRARHDAGMSLYYLSLADMNRSKLTRQPGAAAKLVGAAQEPGVRRAAVMVMASISECDDGREALIDGGAVPALVGVMRDGVAAGSAEEEHCLSALHGISKRSVRFAALARRCGAEEVLQRAAESAKLGPRSRALRMLSLLSGSGAEDGNADESLAWTADDDGGHSTAPSEECFVPSARSTGSSSCSASSVILPTVMPPNSGA